MAALPILALALIAAANATPSDKGWQTQGTAWSIEQVTPPSPSHPDDRYTTFNLFPTGDLDGDSITDFADFGDSIPDVLSGRPGWNRLHFSNGCNRLHEFDILDKTSGPVFMNFQNTRLQLNTPYGRQILLDDGSIRLIEAYRASDGRFWGSVSQPPPPAPGVPPVYGMHWLYAAGDVNFDGYDDAFYTTFAQPYGYCGLIDGATLTVVWQRYDDFVAGILDFISGEPANRPDLDGDGIADFLFGQELFNGAQFGHRVTAVSGLDGATLWERAGFDFPSFRQACGRDLDGDGTADLTLIMEEWTGASVQAWSGADGHLLWTQSIQVADPFFQPGWFARTFQFAIMTPGVESGAEEVILHTIYQYNNTLITANGLTHLDGATGALLEVAELPETLQPWSDEPLMTSPGGGVLLMPAGDVDRDGFQEYAVIMDDPSATPVWSTSQVTRQIAFLGQQNLLMPATAPIGTSFQARLHVPSAPGRDFLMLVGSTFDPSGGLTIQGWQTELDAADPLLQHSWSTRTLRGILDGAGRGTLPIHIPDQTWLIGKTLYFRALVGDPVSGEVWTRSSLGILDVLP